MCVCITGLVSLIHVVTDFQPQEEPSSIEKKREAAIRALILYLGEKEDDLLKDDLVSKTLRLTPTLTSTVYTQSHTDTRTLLLSHRSLYSPSFIETVLALQNVLIQLCSKLNNSIHSSSVTRVRLTLLIWKI